MELFINDRFRDRKIDLFSNFDMTLQYDSVASKFGLSFFFNPENQDHIELAAIGHYHLARLEHNGEVLISGQVLSQGFKDSKEEQLASLGGYSLPGVLEDCNIPTSLYPLQFDGLTLREITEKLIAPFDLKLVVDGVNVNQVFDVTTASEKQSIKDYLTELAVQKDIILTHDNLGRLVYTKAKTKQTAIVHYETGQPNFTEMNLTFNGQAMHSQITAMKQADSGGGNAGEATVINPFVPFVFRPKVITQSSGDDNDSLKAAKSALSAELKNMKLVIKTDQWEIGDTIIKPNNIITVTNPKVFLFEKSRWFIESVNLTGDSKQLVSTLTCVIPSVYDDSTPEYLFEGINIHA